MKLPYRKFDTMRLAPPVSLLAIAALAGCAIMSDPPRDGVALAPKVDLPRFMGDWYVIANIPTFLEKGAHNTKDNYKLDPDGSIATTFTFNADGFNGPLKNYTSRGFVLNAANSVWGQQYIWPLQADYRIAYLSTDYNQTVIARDKRDYVWIMARTPAIPDADFERLKAFVGTQGYDVNLLQRVPQAAR